MQFSLFATSASAQSGLTGPHPPSAQHAIIQSSKAQEIREFVSYQYRELAKDIVIGNGPYLLALSELVSPNTADEKKLPIQIIEEKLFELQNPATFANYLASSLPEK